MDVIRAVAHFVVLVCFLYLAIDERAARRPYRSLMWAMLALERLSFLTLLAIDVSRNGAIWVEWRASLTPFIILVAIALVFYVAGRIRAKYRLRRDIAPLIKVMV